MTIKYIKIKNDQFIVDSIRDGNREKELKKLYDYLPKIEKLVVSKEGGVMLFQLVI